MDQSDTRDHARKPGASVLAGRSRYEERFYMQAVAGGALPGSGGSDPRLDSVGAGRRPRAWASAASRSDRPSGPDRPSATHPLGLSRFRRRGSVHVFAASDGRLAEAVHFAVGRARAGPVATIPHASNAPHGRAIALLRGGGLLEESSGSAARRVGQEPLPLRAPSSRLDKTLPRMHGQNQPGRSRYGLKEDLWKMIYTPIEHLGKHFIPIQHNPEADLVIVFLHGIGDLIFGGPCFCEFAKRWKKVWLISGVNAYASLYHESPYISPIYCGGVNGSNMGFRSAESVIRHLQLFRVPFVSENVHVMFNWMHEPWDTPYRTKAMAYWAKCFGEPIPAIKYQVWPDSIYRQLVEDTLNRWYPERDLICVARYGHTSTEKNFGHSYHDIIETIDFLNRAKPNRYRFIALEYMPGDVFCDGRREAVRSVYGFLPCDAATQYWILQRAKLLITVPTGPMVLAQTIPGMKILSIWKVLNPNHYSDPQPGIIHHALIGPGVALPMNETGISWFSQCEITPKVVAHAALEML